jgi:mannose-1-phosphate guanylyltransferase
MNKGLQTTNKNLYAVIMAGGVGSRFWPVSTPENPKQFHDLLGTGKSLLQQTFDRILPLVAAENILISTNEKYKELTLQQLSLITENQLVLEPAMRNTAPAILYTALKINALNPDALILIAPSDHWIDREDIFLEKLTQSYTQCQAQDVLMTMGIVPTYPNTGYGYIQFKKGETDIKKVTRFTEKPDYENAVKFIESGDFLWNAGIFIWSAKSILKAFEQFLPQTFSLLSKGNALYNTNKESEFIKENYPKSENISVDYAILEKAENVFVLPVDMGWNDLGTWGALYQKMEKDTNENAVVNAQVYFDDAHQNIIRTDHCKKVIIKGLQDFIVVDYQDTLMIVPKNDEQAIKELSKKI